ncbi:alpha/beta fold hydrolase [Methanobacterium paludis]|uniref:Carboxymethylenebutenolidase-related protein n=1 Tax=Methanobacterium paludis (strain DSM 25820 / JCM 18151 / SWAN1) TaxID=868131 RepID=F6D5A5_METPW|nr:alpha/beta fold hydrolase [Methanobacterium paludis]AEG18213.1 carboxymethylenebutenolidase-related protein [Methanobacterium paludis]
MKSVRSKKKLILVTILAVIFVMTVAFIYYVSDYYHADNRALAVLKSTESYNVSDTPDYITFTPSSNGSTTGIIIYPGAKIQAEAYSVIASKLAQKGYTTVIVKMPFNLAFLGVDKADGVIAKHGEIDKWVIAGHSLGGVFASEYALKHEDKISGVIYLGAYPSTNASNATFKALSIRGSLDGLTTDKSISENLGKFPANTTFVTIAGGNHYNFGDYGVQAGDNSSTITRKEQQDKTVSYIVGFVEGL